MRLRRRARLATVWAAAAGMLSAGVCAAVDPAAAAARGTAAGQAGAGCFRVTATDIGRGSDRSTYPVAVNDRGQIAVSDHQYDEMGNLAGSGYLWHRGRVREFGHLPGGGWSAPAAMNERGEVAGADYTNYEGGPAFIWRRGTMTRLGARVPGQVEDDRVVAINDRGQVAGTSPDGDSGHAFVWSRGRIVDLGALASDYSHASDINNRGQVVGQSPTADGGHHAFLWHRGVMADLGALPGADPSHSWPAAINDHGQVVGWSYTKAGWGRAVLWHRGVLTDLGTLGGRQSGATAISDRGHVVGSSETATGQLHAFLWRDGAMTDLGALPGGESYATDVNDAGQVVGASTTSTDGGWHPVLWQRGTLTDLDPAAFYGSVTDINNRGLAVGYAQPDSASPRRATAWRTTRSHC